MGDLGLSEKLRVIRMIDDWLTPQAAANQFELDVGNVMSEMQTRKRFESLDKSPTKRSNLSLRDKLRVMHLMDADKINLT